MQSSDTDSYENRGSLQKPWFDKRTMRQCHLFVKEERVEANQILAGKQKAFTGEKAFYGMLLLIRRRVAFIAQGP